MTWLIDSPAATHTSDSDLTNFPITSSFMSLPEKVRHYFERYSVPFTAACREIISSDIPPTATYACFWIQPVDFFGEFLPIDVGWWNAEGLIASLDPSPLEAIRTEHWSWGKDRSSDEPDPQVFNILCDWISICWNSAGGDLSKIPFYCYDYYSMDTYCLRKNRLISYSELQADTRPPMFVPMSASQV